jgi:hypothetical protein
MSSRAIDLGRESRLTEDVQRAASTSALDSIHIAPLTEAHRLYSQASRVFHPERDMVLAPLHTRMLAMASSFKQEQLNKLQLVIDELLCVPQEPSAAASSTASSLKSKKGKLRKPLNIALKRCCPCAPLLPLSYL